MLRWGLLWNLRQPLNQSGNAAGFYAGRLGRGWRCWVKRGRFRSIRRWFRLSRCSCRCARRRKGRQQAGCASGRRGWARSWGLALVGVRSDVELLWSGAKVRFARPILGWRLRCGRLGSLGGRRREWLNSRCRGRLWWGWRRGFKELRKAAFG